jgi:hypothetical protein
VVHVKGQAYLFEVVLALHASRCFADFLDGGQQESNEDGYDGDHHQQLDQRKGRPSIGHDLIPLENRQLETSPSS